MHRFRPCRTALAGLLALLAAAPVAAADGTPPPAPVAGKSKGVMMAEATM